MREALMAVGFSMVLAGGAAAQGWVTPERGTATRAQLMDAIRPHAEWMLGAPVEFVVNDLRLLGDRAFAMLEAQRPGGGKIDMFKTPMIARGEFDPYIVDTPHIEVLYVKSGDTWVALHWAIGATDVWYAWEPICAPFRALIPEACPPF
ncbi:hypothetical protein [Phaeovulum sp.]|uniref:hypothetical protein n=1 Tax=Phaeovulum sp. TaxID=2934796 RepID=UPI003562980A